MVGKGPKVFRLLNLHTCCHPAQQSLSYTCRSGASSSIPLGRPPVLTRSIRLSVAVGNAHPSHFRGAPLTGLNAAHAVSVKQEGCSSILPVAGIPSLLPQRVCSGDPKMPTKIPGLPSSQLLFQHLPYWILRYLSRCREILPPSSQLLPQLLGIVLPRYLAHMAHLQHGQG